MSAKPTSNDGPLPYNSSMNGNDLPEPPVTGTAFTVPIRETAFIHVASGIVAGKNAAIISKVECKRDLGVSPGQVVLGRSANGNHLSFVGMPLDMVQKELAQLNESRRLYSLTLSYPSNSPVKSTGKVSPRRHGNTEGSPNIRSPSPTKDATRSPSPRRNKSDSITSSPGQNSTTQGYRTRRNSSMSVMSSAAATAAAAEYLSPGATSQIYQAELARAEQYASAGQDTASLTMQFDESAIDLNTIKASVERLRHQRIETENLRKQFRHKDTIIRKLGAENHDLHSKVQALQEMIETQNNLLAELTVSEEKVKIMKTKEAEVSKLLTRERNERETERKEHELQVQGLRREVATLQVRSNRDQMSLAETKTDLVSVQKEMESLSQLHKQAEERAKNMGKRMDSEYAGIYRERSELREYILQLEESLQQCRTDLACKSDELTLAENSSELARGTVLELERNLEVLRGKLSDQEASSSAQISEVSKTLHDVSSRLNEETAKREHLEEENEQLKRKLQEEMDSHKSTREVLLRRGNEHGELSARVFQLTQNEQNLKNKNEVLTNKLEQSHKRLLEEMGKNVKYTQQIENERNACRTWARERSDLLSQFCVEERRFQQTTAALRDEVNRTNAMSVGALLGSSSKSTRPPSWTVPQNRTSMPMSAGAPPASASGVKHFYHYKSKQFSTTPVPFASFTPRPRTGSNDDSVEKSAAAVANATPTSGQES